MLLATLVRCLGLQPTAASTGSRCSLYKIQRHNDDSVMFCKCVVMSRRQDCNNKDGVKPNCNVPTKPSYNYLNPKYNPYLCVTKSKTATVCTAVFHYRSTSVLSTDLCCHGGALSTKTVGCGFDEQEQSTDLIIWVMWDEELYNISLRSWCSLIPRQSCKDHSKSPAQAHITTF